MTWRNHNDFMNDIWAISEMEGIGRPEVEEIPDSILEYRARMAANNTGSIYDEPEPEENEDVTYIMSGRGRGGISTILRPGVSQLSDNLVVEDVQKKLRQVAGLGYSNSLIEQGVRAMTIANDKSKPSPAKQRSIKPSSSKSSPRKTPISTSGVCSPLEKERSSSSCSSLDSTSPCRPPPLSIMLKNAQKPRQKPKDNAPENEEATYASTIKQTRQEAALKKEKKNGRITNGLDSPSNGLNRSWQDKSGSSSDEGSWRRKNESSANLLFQSSSNNFSLNCDDFPALN